VKFCLDGKGEIMQVLYEYIIVVLNETRNMLKDWEWAGEYF
jgi:hypothetical protein